MSPLRRVALAHYSSADDISGVTSWLVALARFLKDQGVTVGIQLLDLTPHGEPSPLELELRGRLGSTCSIRLPQAASARMWKPRWPS